MAEKEAVKRGLHKKKSDSASKTDSYLHLNPFDGIEVSKRLPNKEGLSFLLLL